MGITDVFKTKQFKSDIERLTAENEYLNSLLTPEMKNAVSINAEIQRLTAENETLKTEIENNKIKCRELELEIEKKKDFVMIKTGGMPF